jgi:hypothetical protein
MRGNLSEPGYEMWTNLNCGPVPTWAHALFSLQILCNDEWDEPYTTQAVEGK